MTLVISMWDPVDKDTPRFEGDTSFGFERYRDDLWDTDAVRSVGTQLIPQLATRDVYVENSELGALEQEARSIMDNAESIAAALFDISNPGEGAVAVRDGNQTRLHNAFGGQNPAESIRRYIGNLFRAIGLANESKCGLVIW